MRAARACVDANLETLQQAEIVRRRQGGEAARHEVIAPVAGPHLDHVALFAKVGHVFGQHQLHAAVRSLEHLVALLLPLFLRRRHDLSPRGCSRSLKRDVFFLAAAARRRFHCFGFISS